MSTKKLFGIFMVIIFLCVGALTYLLINDGTDKPVISPNNQSGENINPGIEIILSGDDKKDEENDDKNTENSGEELVSGENEEILSGEEIAGPTENPTESELPAGNDNNDQKEPVSPSPSRVDDSFVAEVKELSKDDKYKFYDESGKLVFVMGDSQTLVYEYQGETLTAYRKYDAYPSEELAKIVADSNNGPDGPIPSDVKKVTYSENYVIWEFKEEAYSKYTVQDIRDMYASFQIKK